MTIEEFIQTHEEMNLIELLQEVRRLTIEECKKIVEIQFIKEQGECNCYLRDGRYDVTSATAIVNQSSFPTDLNNIDIQL